MCCNQTELTSAEAREVISECSKARLEVCTCACRKNINVRYTTMKINGSCAFYLEGCFNAEILAALEASNAVSFVIRNRDCCGCANAVTVSGTPAVFDGCGENEKIIRVIATDISGVKTC